MSSVLPRRIPSPSMLATHAAPTARNAGCEISRGEGRVGQLGRLRIAVVERPERQRRAGAVTVRAEARRHGHRRRSRRRARRDRPDVAVRHQLRQRIRAAAVIVAASKPQQAPACEPEQHPHRRPPNCEHVQLLRLMWKPPARIASAVPLKTTRRIRPSRRFPDPAAEGLCSALAPHVRTCTAARRSAGLLDHHQHPEADQAKEGVGQPQLEPVKRGPEPAAAAAARGRSRPRPGSSGPRGARRCGRPASGTPRRTPRPGAAEQQRRDRLVRIERIASRRPPRGHRQRIDAERERLLVEELVDRIRQRARCTARTSRSARPGAGPAPPRRRTAAAPAGGEGRRTAPARPALRRRTATPPRSPRDRARGRARCRRARDRG